MQNYQVGDIVKLSKAYQEGFPLTKRQQTWRWRVEAVLEDDRDLDGNPILKCRRLDLASHKIEKWSQAWLEKAEQEG